MNTDSKKVYGIRDKKTGLWSDGGMNPTFSKRGKIWNTMGALKGHLAQFYYREYPNRGVRIASERMKDLEVVEFEVVQNEKGIYDVSDLMIETAINAGETIKFIPHNEASRLFCGAY